MSGSKTAFVCCLLALGLTSEGWAQSVIVAGNARTHITSAMNAEGEAFTENTAEWATPNSADVLIVSRDGGTSPVVDYQSHLDAGRHFLMI